MRPPESRAFAVTSSIPRCFSTSNALPEIFLRSVVTTPRLSTHIVLQPTSQPASTVMAGPVRLGVSYLLDWVVVM